MDAQYDDAVKKRSCVIAGLYRESFPAGLMSRTWRHSIMNFVCGVALSWVDDCLCLCMSVTAISKTGHTTHSGTFRCFYRRMDTPCTTGSVFKEERATCHGPLPLALTSCTLLVAETSKFLYAAVCVTLVQVKCISGTTEFPADANIRAAQWR